MLTGSVSAISRRRWINILNRTLRRFLIYFVVFFILIMIFGAIFKPFELGFDGIVRALVISSASAFGWVFVERRFLKK